MKKIILYIAASLDGYIAEPDGSLEWLITFPNPEKTDYGHNDFLLGIDTVIMGGRTYRELLDMDVIWPYKGQQTFVVSRHDWGAKQGICFITENITDTISGLCKQVGKDIGVVGGGELASMLLVADLINEIQILHIPTILGKGVPLFPGQSQASKWELTGNKAYENGVLHVTYQRK